MKSKGAFQRCVVRSEPVGYFTRVEENLKLGEEIQLAARAGLELGASEFQARRSRIWTRDNREQIQQAVRAGLELGA